MTDLAAWQCPKCRLRRSSVSAVGSCSVCDWEAPPEGIPSVYYCQRALCEAAKKWAVEQETEGNFDICDAINALEAAESRARLRAAHCYLPWSVRARDFDHAICGGACNPMNRGQ